MDEYKKFLDTGWDFEFLKLDCPWLPWVGRHYKKETNRILVLGESTFNFGKTEEKRIEVAKRIDKTDHLRVLHYNNTIKKFNLKAVYLRNLERAILRRSRVTQDEAIDFWERVSYHNLILTPMSSIKQRPSNSEYLDGWNKLINDFSDVIQFNQVLVYGLERPKIITLKEVLRNRNVHFVGKKLEPKIGKSFARKISFAWKGREISILFIRHPSAYFDWKSWGEVISEQGFNLFSGNRQGE